MCVEESGEYVETLDEHTTTRAARDEHGEKKKSRKQFQKNTALKSKLEGPLCRLACCVSFSFFTQSRTTHREYST